MAAVFAAQLPPVRLSKADHINAGQLIWMLEASFNYMARELLNISSKDGLFDTFVNGTRTPVFCPGLPRRSPDKLPFKLDERCPGNGSTRGDFDRCTGPDATYAAYTNWCAPSFCHVISDKSTYHQVAEMMSLIGGIYGGWLPRASAPLQA